MRIVAIPSGEELKKEFYEGEKEFDADCVFDRVVFVVPNPTKTQQYFKSNKVEVFESASHASHQQPAGRRDFDAHTLHTHIMMRG